MNEETIQRNLLEEIEKSTTIIDLIDSGQPHAFQDGAKEWHSGRRAMALQLYQELEKEKAKGVDLDAMSKRFDEFLDNLSDEDIDELIQGRKEREEEVPDDKIRRFLSSLDINKSYQTIATDHWDDVTVEDILEQFDNQNKRVVDWEEFRRCFADYYSVGDKSREELAEWVYRFLSQPYDMK